MTFHWRHYVPGWQVLVARTRDHRVAMNHQTSYKLEFRILTQFKHLQISQIGCLNKILESGCKQSRAENRALVTNHPWPRDIQERASARVMTVQLAPHMRTQHPGHCDMHAAQPHCSQVLEHLEPLTATV